MNVTAFLNGKRARYEVCSHPTAFDAQRLAAALHVPGGHFAKTVLLRANGGFKYVLAVVPATARVDLQRVSCALGGADVRLATELEIADRCPECEVGVLPPFGSQLGMETIVDESLAKQEEMFFEGNTHAEAIRMSYLDYYAIEHPLVMPIVERDASKRESSRHPASGETT